METTVYGTLSRIDAPRLQKIQAKVGKRRLELRFRLPQVSKVACSLLPRLANNVFRFVVIGASRDTARKIFNSPAFLKPTVVDIAPKLLRPTNWVFLDGREHVDYRKGLNGLFTRQALEAYLPGQEEVYSTYFKTFVNESKENDGKPKPWMPILRELMTAVSCRTFVGHYMSDQVVKRIAEDYYLITASLELVNFPIIIPFTKTWYGKKACDMVMDEFAKCAAKSKVRMAAGGSVTCTMDAWVKQMQDSAKYKERIARGENVDSSEKPAQVLREFSDMEISQTIFTLLFASQDATSSACTWLFQIMADRPEILAKVREENLALRGGDRNKPFDMDMLESMVWTRAVVKETLRYRPPVIFVPYVAKKDFPMTENYTVKKGSMVIPALWPATHDPEAYPDPDNFVPERWITGDADKQVKNWLVFGTGPHHCLGQTYAQLNLMAMIGKASILLDWVHEPTAISEDIEVFATIFPQVSPGSFMSMRNGWLTETSGSLQADLYGASLDTAVWVLFVSQFVGIGVVLLSDDYKNTVHSNELVVEDEKLSWHDSS